MPYPSGSTSASLLRIVVAPLDPQGKLDPTYGTAGIASIFGTPQAAALQADGKLVIVGGRRYSPAIVARLDKDGSPDTTFGARTAGAGANIVNTGGLTGTNDGNVGVAIRYDGDIFVAFSSFDEPTAKYYVGQLRVSPDGSLRTTYGSGGGVRALDGSSHAIFARNDPGSLLYGSIVHVATSSLGYSFAQRTADDTPDPDLNVSPSARLTPTALNDYAQYTGQPCSRMARA